MADRASRLPSPRWSRWYAIAAPLVAASALHGAPGRADPLVEPWRVARADPVSRLRSTDPARRHGAAYALLRDRLAGGAGPSEAERADEDEALFAIIAQDSDLSARLTALTALGLPVTRDASHLEARLDALRVRDLGPPPLSIAALHAYGSAPVLEAFALDWRGAVPDDDLGAVAVDALAVRFAARVAGRAVDDPLRWRVLARRGDPSPAAALLAELARAAGALRGPRAMAAVGAVRTLRLAEAAPAVLAVALRAPDRELRRRATLALGELGGVGVGDLTALVGDPITRASAYEAIGRLRLREALPLLREGLSLDDPGDRLAARDALGLFEGRAEADEGDARVGTAALERRLLTDADDGARVAAATVLARRRGLAALPLIEAAARVAWSATMIDGLSRAAALARAEP